VDETYVKIKGKWSYLYRAVDSTGQTIDFMLSAKRDARAAKWFFRKILKTRSYSSRRVINVDKNLDYPPEVEQSKEEGAIPSRTQLRQCKYLNNLIEQDHRFIKRRVNSGLGFFSFNTAWRTIRRYESMNLIRKWPIAGIGRRDIQMQVRFVSNLFGIAAQIGARLGLFLRLYSFLQHNPHTLTGYVSARFFQNSTGWPDSNFPQDFNPKQIIEGSARAVLKRLLRNNERI
jgi:transposase, IS6 family